MKKKLRKSQLNLKSKPEFVRQIMFFITVLKVCDDLHLVDQSDFFAS